MIKIVKWNETFEKKLLEYIHKNNSQIIESIKAEKALTKENEENLKEVLTSFISEEANLL